MEPRQQAQQQDMVQRQLIDRGVRSEAVLEAMRKVPRAGFVPIQLKEFAYEDTPLPLEEGQSVPQPFVIAAMIEALELQKGDKVLEIGTGAGYPAAVLGEIAGTVFAVERYRSLAESSHRNLESHGYDNVHVIHGDGSGGYPKAAPYDAILVLADAPEVPDALRKQLAVGGRLVMPVGPQGRMQTLTRVRRTDKDWFEEEQSMEVRFAPLVGRHGWQEPDAGGRPATRETRKALPRLIARRAEAFEDVESADLDGIIERINDARLVLLGEASHGTSEFYRMRDLITRRLIEQKGFDFVAVEADWPDAGRIDHYVRHLDTPPAKWAAFSRFPTWMWRNEEFRRHVEWLRNHNRSVPEGDRVSFHGLDLYSLYASIQAVLGYLDDVDPEAAAVARERYGCLTPWQSDPVTYGHAALTGRYEGCEPKVVEMLKRLLEKRSAYVAKDGDRYLDALQNARLIADAEEYYRVMFYGAVSSWNLRDSHMFETLSNLLHHHGPNSRGVVWAHNSHLGDARYTEMSVRGEHNLGQLCRERFGDQAYLVGFGTHAGQVAAADNWGEDVQVKDIRDSHPDSYERACHDSHVGNFFLPLGREGDEELTEQLMEQRLERAIGVIYRPQTELASHYFRATLPRQFNEYIWLDRTTAVQPLDTKKLDGVPDTYPFGV